MATRVYLTTTGAGNWTVPSDWNSSDNTIEVIGGGSSGANGVANSAIGGGGGGYSKIVNISLTPGASIPYSVGIGGIGVWVAGGDTWFGNASYASANVGAKGALGGNQSNNGGPSSGGIGTTKYSGGSGANIGSYPGGCGGGGAGGPNGNGKNGGVTGGQYGTIGGQGDNTSGGTGGAGGTPGAGAVGGNGAEWDASHGSGGGGGGGSSNGTTANPGGNGGGYGGGGGAAGYKNGDNTTTGSGAQGIVVITYTPPPPAAPTNVAATDGTYTDKVTVTWTKSTGATGYKIYRGGSLLNTLGDVDTYDDSTAPAGSITPGSAVATDGSSTANVGLSITGASTSNGSSQSYSVSATNASGEGSQSSANTGYRGVGALTYQWQRSAGDSDASYSALSGFTSSTGSDTTAPAPTITGGTATASDGTYTDHVALSLSGQSANNGAGRYYNCVLSATGASQQTTTSNRGYIGVGALTYQWQRSAGDSDASFSDLGGATSSTYNDTTAPPGSGRYYLCNLGATGASVAASTHDRGYIKLLSGGSFLLNLI